MVSPKRAERVSECERKRSDARKIVFSVTVPGGHTGGAPPVPIPNTEVKPSKADATAAARQWESRTLPGYNEGPLVERSAGLFFCLPAAKPTFFSLLVAKCLSAAI